MRELFALSVPTVTSSFLPTITRMLLFPQARIRFVFIKLNFNPPPPPPPDQFWWVELQGLTVDGYGAEEDDLFPDYVLPPPPAGWQAFRLGHR